MHDDAKACLRQGIDIAQDGVGGNRKPGCEGGAGQATTVLQQKRDFQKACGAHGQNQFDKRYHARCGKVVQVKRREAYEYDQ